MYGARSQRPAHRPRIIPSKTPGGPILIHDCSVYRARVDHGPNGDHYTRQQLEKIFREAVQTKTHGIPILDTHLYDVQPIGRISKWWFTPDNWLHCSGEIFGEDVLGPQRYQHTLRNIKNGSYKDVSLSVAQGILPNGKHDPNNLRLNEISVCREGRHKNCNIKIVEASDQSQSKKTYHHDGGQIMSLTIQHENGTTGGLDTSKLDVSVENLVAEAAARGVPFTQAEIDDYAKAGPQGYLAASQLIIAKMADKMANLAQENDGMKGIVNEVEQNYARQRENDIAMVKEFYGEKVKSGKMTEERAKQLSDEAEAMGKNREYATKFDTMISGILELKEQAAQIAELSKSLEKSKATANRMQREHNREQKRDLSPKRAPVAPPAAQQKPATAAPPAAATAPAKSAIPSPNAVAPADANSAPTDQPPNPGEMAQSLTPHPQYSQQGYVLANASAEHGDSAWINKCFPLAYQGQFARSLASESMSRIYDIMDKPNYFNDTIGLRVPPVGEQGFARRNNGPTYYN